MKNKHSFNLLKRIPFILFLLIFFTTCKKNDTTSKDEMLYDYQDNSNDYATLGGKWNRTNITWYIERGCNELSLPETKDLIKRAFKTWSDVSTLTFSEVSSISAADIVISWGNNDHYTQVNNRFCLNPFTITTPNVGVLAHAYGPPPHNYLTGDIHFCDLHKWTPFGEANNVSISILSVAIHEIGHSLGLDHSNDRSAIMFKSYDPSNPKFLLSNDDIDGIRSLYGSSTNNGAKIRIAGVCPAGVPTNTTRQFNMTVYNDGNQNLQISNIQVQSTNPGVFYLTTALSYPIILAPNTFRDISVTFAPTTTQIYYGNFTVSSNSISGSNSSQLAGQGSSAQTNTTFTDTRDGQTYRTVQIGSQVWLAENFRYNVSGSIAYNYDNNNIATHGRLYNWQQALNAVPSGWRLPTDDEWKQLEINSGMSSTEANSYGDRYNSVVATKLLIGGSSSLDLTLSGYMPYTTFYNLNISGHYWTSTTYPNNSAYGRNIDYSKIGRYGTATGAFQSVRLIKN